MLRHVVAIATCWLSLAAATVAPVRDAQHLRALLIARPAAIHMPRTPTIDNGK